MPHVLIPEILFISFYALLLGIAMRIYEVGMRPNGIFFWVMQLAAKKVRNLVLFKLITCSRCLSVWFASGMFWIMPISYSIFNFLAFVLLSFLFTDKLAQPLQNDDFI